jgi:hypothetical protein
LIIGSSHGAFLVMKSSGPAGCRLYRGIDALPIEELSRILDERVISIQIARLI